MDSPYETLPQPIDRPMTPEELRFDLVEALKAVLHFWGPEGANKITRHVLTARRARDSNAEMDELEKLFGSP